jgi:hypothetical protein
MWKFKADEISKIPVDTRTNPVKTQKLDEQTFGRAPVRRPPANIPLATQDESINPHCEFCLFDNSDQIKVAEPQE